MPISESSAKTGTGQFTTRHSSLPRDLCFRVNMGLLAPYCVFISSLNNGTQILDITMNSKKFGSVDDGIVVNATILVELNPERKIPEGCVK